MDTVTLSKQNRLFWLGRYTSRAYGSIRYMMQQLDARIDGQPVPYQDFCRRMGIPCPYENEEAFCRRYLFDAADPASVRSCVDAMLGNGMTLRETITSPTLAYLQMAQSAMDLAARSEAPAVELQWVLDDIMAFRGSFDDTVEAENVRNITKTGGLVERLSLMLRLGLQPQFVDRELRKLLNRLYKTGLPPQPDALALIERQALEERPAEPQALLAAVEGAVRSMSRTLRFSYEIRLAFSAPVTRHIFVLRCMPPSLPGQQIVSATLTLDPPVPYTVQQDSFGNLLQAGRIDGPHDHFCYGVCGTARMDLSGRQLTRRSPLFCLPSAFTRPSPEMLDWLAALPLPETPRQRAWALARAVHSRLTYAPGATGVATTAAQAFHNGRGVCQDFAHVYLALARQAGLAARYVNGLPQGEGVSHAWCEVWLDGFWTGIDPTRLQWTDEGYLRFGAGRDFGDCPIERGVFLGSARQEQQVFMRVSQQSF